MKNIHNLFNLEVSGRYILKCILPWEATSAVIIRRWRQRANTSMADRNRDGRIGRRSDGKLFAVRGRTTQVEPGDVDLRIPQESTKMADDSMYVRIGHAGQSNPGPSQ
jgi:hypothetical protein